MEIIERDDGDGVHRLLRHNKGGTEKQESEEQKTSEIYFSYLIIYSKKKL
jgi:hypothetical protein